MNSFLSRCTSAALALACSPFALAGTPPDPPVFQQFLGGFTSPIGLTHAGDGSGRLFVNQQGGALRVVRNGSLLSSAYLTLNSNTQCTYPGAASAVTVRRTAP